MIDTINFKEYEENINNYEIVKNLGDGVSSNVYQVKNKISDNLYAIKILKPDSDPLFEKRVKREIDIMITCQHQTINKIYGYATVTLEGKKIPAIIMDYKERGSLKNLIENEAKALCDIEYDNTKKQIILIGTSKGLQVLHQHDIVHRDLKPDNILLNANYEPFITDFNLSKFCDLDLNQILYLSAQVGTNLYKAPEVFKDDYSYDDGNQYKTDVYAFGIIVYEIITNKYPFPELLGLNESQISEKLLNKECKVEFPEYIKLSFKNLIEKCLSYEPSDRPTFSEIYEKLTEIENDNGCILDGVDKNEIKDYIEYINEKNPANDVYSLRIAVSKLKSQNLMIQQHFNEKVKDVKNDNEQLNKRVERLEKIIQKLLPDSVDENNIPSLKDMIDQMMENSINIDNLMNNLSTESNPLHIFIEKMILNFPKFAEIEEKFDRLFLIGQQYKANRSENTKSYEEIISTIKDLQNNVSSLSLQVKELQAINQSKNDSENNKIMSLIKELQKKVELLTEENKLLNQLLIDQKNDFEEENEALKNEFEEKNKAIKAEIEENNKAIKSELENENQKIKNEFDERNKAILANLEQKNKAIMAEFEEKNKAIKNMFASDLKRISQDFANIQNNFHSHIQQIEANNSEKLSLIQIENHKNEENFKQLQLINHKIEEKLRLIQSENHKNEEKFKQYQSINQNNENLIEKINELQKKMNSLQEENKDLKANIDTSKIREEIIREIKQEEKSTKPPNDDQKCDSNEINKEKNKEVTEININSTEITTEATSIYETEEKSITSNNNENKAKPLEDSNEKNNSTETSKDQNMKPSTMNTKPKENTSETNNNSNSESITKDTSKEDNISNNNNKNKAKPPADSNEKNNSTETSKDQNMKPSTMNTKPKENTSETNNNSNSESITKDTSKEYNISNNNNKNKAKPLEDSNEKNNSTETSKDQNMKPSTMNTKPKENTSETNNNSNTKTTPENTSKENNSSTNSSLSTNIQNLNVNQKDDISQNNKDTKNNQKDDMLEKFENLEKENQFLKQQLNENRQIMNQEKANFQKKLNELQDQINRINERNGQNSNNIPISQQNEKDIVQEPFRRCSSQITPRVVNANGGGREIEIPNIQSQIVVPHTNYSGLLSPKNEKDNKSKSFQGNKLTNQKTLLKKPGPIGPIVPVESQSKDISIEEAQNNLRKYFGKYNKNFEKYFLIQQSNNEFLPHRITFKAGAVELFMNDHTLGPNRIKSLISPFEYITVIIQYSSNSSVDSLKKIHDYSKRLFRDNSQKKLLMHLDINELNGINNVLEQMKDIESIKINCKQPIIPHSTFKSCKNITSINIKSFIQAIEEECFADCTSLTSFYIENVEIIGKRAFSGCSSLTSIIIPNSFKNNWGNGI